jgi:hypothetical protein
MQSKAYYAKYYRMNRQRILEQKRLYGIANKGKIAERQRAWVAANKDRKKTSLREYDRKRYEKNAARIAAIKTERGCDRCGQSDPIVLQFHHRDPEQKSAAVPMLCGFSWKKLAEEVAKCSVLCANCHAIEHYEERHLPRDKRKRERNKSKPSPSKPIQSDLFGGEGSDTILA